jgi:dTDP-4-amino-4,6-dideoxygalactose transaminase
VEHAIESNSKQFNRNKEKYLIPQIDLVAQYRTIQTEIDAAIRQVLDSGHFILGPNVAALEREVASYLGVSHGVGVASGTDALVLALRALNIGQGDEVIVPAYTFFATAEAVLLVGATPVFVDIDPQTYCLNVRQLEASITAKTKAVIPVHLYGHPASMKPLLEHARSRGLRVIEDNAQAFGADYEGRKTGSLGDVGCISFFPSKNLGACGDGGMVVTNDPGLAERVRMLRTHGWRRKYEPEMVGYNSRLDEIQAAILRVKLRYIDQWNNRRRELALEYVEQLSSLDIGLPSETPGARHVYHLFVIRLKDRDIVATSLKNAGISTAVYYPHPLHLLKACNHLGYVTGSLPVAENASRETLALPFYPEMTPMQVSTVADALSMALKEI